jgi:DNA-binding transcriptional regulator YbjK
MHAEGHGRGRQARRQDLIDAAWRLLAHTGWR